MTPTPRLDLFWQGAALMRTNITNWLRLAGNAGEVELTVGTDGLFEARRALADNGWRVVSVRAHERDGGFSIVARRGEEGRIP